MTDPKPDPERSVEPDEDPDELVPEDERPVLPDEPPAEPLPDEERPVPPDVNDEA